MGRPYLELLVMVPELSVTLVGESECCGMEATSKSADFLCRVPTSRRRMSCMKPTFEFADPFQVLKNLQGPGRQLFFAGTPGAGSTFVATLTAVYLADCGYRTLLVCPRAPDWLNRALGAGCQTEPCAVENAANLWHFAPAFPQEEGLCDLSLLGWLARGLDERDLDFVILNRVPADSVIARIAAACLRNETVELSPDQDLGERSPTARQWRDLLVRIWDVQVSRFVAVAHAEGFDADRFVHRLAQMKATGMSPGLIVANGLASHEEKEQGTPGATFLSELFAAAACGCCPVVDMPQVSAGNRTLDELRRSARVFFRLGSQARIGADLDERGGNSAI